LPTPGLVRLVTFWEVMDMKKVLSMVLSLLLLANLIPGALFLPVSAATSGDFSYTIANGEATITKYNGSGGDVVIPSTLGGYPVTTVGEKAFYKCTSMTSVTIPSSITTTKEQAFEGCSGLSGVYISDMTAWCNIEFGPNYGNPLGWAQKLYLNNVLVTDLVIPEGVTTIKYCAFWNLTNLTSVTIPSSVVSIDSCAFYGCTGLTSIVIPNGVTAIGDNAFNSCESLSLVLIPNTVATVGCDAFINCNNLTYVCFAGTESEREKISFEFDNTDLLNATWHYVKTPALESDFRYTVNNKKVTITEYEGNGGYVIIPDTLDGFPVTEIGHSAFDFCTGLISVTIPDGVTKIGDSAFWACDNLISVTIPNSVITIDSYAFSYCSSLTSVTIPGSVTTIGGSVFKGCTSLTSISVAVGNVNYCSADGVLFNKNKTMLIQYPGGRSGSYTIPNSVTTIDGFAFSMCAGLTSVTIPVSVTIIGSSAFHNCTSLTSVIIPDRVISIGDYTFSGCTDLISVAIPDIVTTIGRSAFYNCGALRYVWYEGARKSDISISSDHNSDLEEATWVYNVEIKNGHVYNADCDKTCNICGKERDAQKHQYTNETDLTCNSCGFSREKITSLDIKGLATPLVGETLGEYYKRISLTNDRNIIFDGAFFIDESFNVLSESSTFKANTNYTLWIYFSEDYYDVVLSKDCSISVNEGKTIGSRNTYSEGEQLWWADLFVYFEVKEPISIKTQPKTAYAKEGATAKVSVKASGDGLKYQWYIKNAGSSKYSKSSVTKSTYSATMSDKVHNRSVYCIVTDKHGNKVKTNTVSLRRQVTITKQPATAAYAKKGAKVSVKITAKGDGLKYAWYIKNEGGSKYSKSSVTSATYSTTMSSKVKGRRIYCIVTDKYGKTVQSKTFILRESVSITIQPKTVTVAKNKTAKVTVKASGDGLKYTWYIKNAGSFKYSKSSITKATYSVKMSSKVNGRRLYCIVTDKYGNKVQTQTVILKKK